MLLSSHCNLVLFLVLKVFVLNFDIIIYNYNISPFPFLPPNPLKYPLLALFQFMASKVFIIKPHRRNERMRELRVKERMPP